MSSRVDRDVWAKAPFLFLNNVWIKQVDRKPKHRKPNDATIASLFDQNVLRAFHTDHWNYDKTYGSNLSDRWVATCCIDSNAPNMRAKTKSEKEEIM